MSSPIRVLILEDYEDDCLLLLRELRRGGFEPTHLRIDTPSEFESALEIYNWDIVISDYSMPAFSAPIALKILRNSNKDIPFIVVSGNVGEMIAVQLMQFGAADFINKGNLSRLCPAIQRELNKLRIKKERVAAEVITARLWDIFNYSLNEIYVFSATTFRFLVLNQSALHNLNFSMSEMKEKHPWDIKLPETKKLFLERIKPLINSKIKFLHFETQHVRKDGSSYPVDVRLQLSNEKTEPVFFATVLDITERKKAVGKIESIAKFPEENPEPVLRLSHEGEILYNNPSSKSLIESWKLENSNKVPSTWKTAVKTCSESLNNYLFEETINNRIYSWLLFPSATEKYINCYGRDITIQKESQNVLKQSAQVFNNISEGIMICDENDMITAINPAFSKITSFSQEDIIGRHATTVISDKVDYKTYRNFKSTAIKNGKWIGEFTFQKDNGNEVPVHLSVTTIKEENTVSSLIFVFSDIGERKLAQQHIHNLSYFDPLTNLPNRLHIHEKLFDLLEESSSLGQSVSVIYLGLNRFKTINESFGHQTADRALSLVANRLSDVIPNNAFLGRMGADEFIIIVNNCFIENDDNQIIHDLMRPFQKSYELQGDETYINATLGVSHFPENGTTVDALIKHSESAMACAKREEKSLAIYTNSMYTTNKEHIKFETRLRKALEKQEFVLYYQPKIDLKTREIVGLEALIRWINSEKQLIPPNDFIPLLEETGLIIPVGNWVIKEACQQIKTWEKEGIETVNISVNISGKQFNQKNVVSNIKNILDSSGVSPSMIELEVTESTIMRNHEKVIEILTELHDHKFQISIDDFGTGYSSLAYLKHFPIDILKIDRSFVMEIPEDKADTAIVNTIISMGHNLNLKVVAEGVETIEQMNILNEMGCELAQGFYFSKPLPAEDIGKLLKDKKC